jgi:hypothetical protein
MSNLRTTVELKTLGYINLDANSPKIFQRKSNLTAHKNKLAKTELATAVDKLKQKFNQSI